MRKIRTVSLAVMLSFGAAQAQEGEIWVKGSVNCALWASAREAKTSGQLEHYVLGFINGVALSYLREIWIYPNKIEPEQVYYFIDVYCANNPLQNVVDGTYALFDDRFGKGWNLQ